MNTQDLIDRLRALPTETEWLEFKRDNSHPQEIGEYLSTHSLRPLLDLSGRVPFSKGFSKGPSKGGLATRVRAARGALLDGHLSGRRIAP